MGAISLICRDPFKAGQNARQRPCITVNHISANRQAKIGIASRITIRIQHDRPVGKINTVKNMAQNRFTGQFSQVFIAATHAPRLPTGKQYDC
jgi:hypothetical protein